MPRARVPLSRSEIMARIRPRDSEPELVVRRTLHALGLRFRLHVRRLPGTPDVVLPRHRTVVLVHGCFWHRHAGCPYSTVPKTNADFWQEKFARNVERDRTVAAELKGLGWRVLVVWECETRDPAALRRRLRARFPRRPSARDRPAARGARGGRRGPATERSRPDTVRRRGASENRSRSTK